jgi:acetyl coenzyme A synthetase (ADP forming)-like protein
MGLENILNAESVAIVGASKSHTKRGYQAIRTLLDEKFEGDIYPVNPKEKNILGVKCYAKVSDIEGNVDIALITTPAKTLPSILEDCGKKGVHGAVVIAGGFGETGEQGKKLEKQMINAAGKYNIRIIGPNTSGMMNLKSNLNLVGLRDSPKGEIALLTQSGNMALALITEARIKSSKGFSYYVGVGNEADIKFDEYLKFFREDPDTRSILMYVEGMRDGRSFLQEAYKTSLKKPIILLKSGRSSTGKQSAGSHTGALAGISEVAYGAFHRAGIITIENSDELFPAAETLSSLPYIKNNRIAILADGGGHATIAADLLTELGVEIPPLSEKTRSELRKILPDTASLINPVDVAGGTDDNPALFADCAAAILKDKGIGGLLIVGLFGGYGIRFDESLSFDEEDAAHQMGKLVRKKKKPIIMHSLYTFEKPHSHDLLRYNNIPVYDSLDIACKCVSVLAEYGRYLATYQSKVNFTFNWRKKAHQNVEELIGHIKKEGRNILLEQEAKTVFREHGVPIPEEELAITTEEAIQIANRFDGPVAMKIVSPDILHKSDAGGVCLGLKTEKEVGNAFNKIIQNAKRFNPDADIRGALIAPMIEDGIEVIIGTKIDDQFGPVIMFGIGGTMVEVMKDVVFRVLPISYATARKMVQEIRAVRLLDGFRGTPPYDKKSIKRLLMIVSEVIESYPEIKELDLNPVIVQEHGLKIADARIILR